MNLINKALAAAENDELAADWRKEPAQYAPVIRELVARVAELEGLLSAAQQGVLPVAWLAEYVDREGNSAWYVSTHKELAVENDMHGTPRPLYTHPTTQGMDAATLDALQEAESVLNSINMGKQHKVVQSDGDVTYWQREEWCKWAKDEVLPKVTAAIAAQEKQGEQANG